MAARDRYTSKIECPNCHEKGILHISEDDHPYMRELHRKVDSVEGPFSATMANDENIAVYCNACGHKFVK